MPYIRLHEHEKEALEYLAGRDYSMNDIIRILLDDFCDYNEDGENE